MADTFYVTWPRNASSDAAARAAAQIWGIPPGQPPPPQLASMFQAGPFQTRADAQAYVNQIGTGAILPAPGTPIVGNISENSVQNALTSLNPLAGLFQANLWIRVAEVALGLILIAVGVARITHAVPAATKIAKTAGAVALA